VVPRPSSRPRPGLGQNTKEIATDIECPKVRLCPTLAPSGRVADQTRPDKPYEAHTSGAFRPDVRPPGAVDKLGGRLATTTSF